ncbi:MAG: Ig-like domain-containing protein, partial [Bacteroidales bacterium]|nr:Ig-like domain-containing protein [Bacteroidales bacterium]
TWENGVTYTRVYDAQNRLTQTTYINISDRYPDTVVETYTMWSTDDPEPVTGVTLNKNTLTLTVDDTERLTATVNPSNATNRSVTWASSNTAVATVNQSGLVTAVSEGTATITVTTVEGNFKANCVVTVGPAVVAVTSVTLNKYTATLTVGGTSEQLVATVNPDNAENQVVTWESNNTSVATVDQTGLVSPVSAGTATITVTTDDGGHTATASVTVIELGDCNENALLVVKLYDSIATLLLSIDGLKTDTLNKGNLITNYELQITNLNKNVSDLNDTITRRNSVITNLNATIVKLTADTLRLYNQLLDCQKGTSNANLIPQEQIEIYPNPVNYELRVVIPNEVRDLNTIVELFDMTGKRVYFAPANNSEISINMTNFQSGNYILRIGHRVAKVVKQ